MKPFFCKQIWIIRITALTLLAGLGAAMFAYTGPNRTRTEAVIVCKIILWECQYVPAQGDWRYHQVRDWSCSNESKPWEEYPSQPPPSGCYEEVAGPPNQYWTREESVEDIIVTYPPAEISAQPLCSLTGQNGWCRGEAGLQLTGYEPVAGEHITGLEGTLNGETFAVQNSASAVIPALEGQSDFQYWAHSSFADTSLMGASSLLLDSQPPLVTASSLVGTLGNNSWYISEVGISLSFTDPTPGSGLDGVTYLLGGGAPQPFTSPLTLGDGQHEVLIRAADLAGNLTELSQTVKIDTIPPHLEDSLEGTLFDSWYAKTALLSASANDTGSGLAGLDLSLDGGAWTTYDSPLTIGDGQHQAVFRARDLAGNVTLTAPLSFRVDAKGPKIDLPERWNIWDTAAFVVRDGGSGLGSVEVIISDSQGRWPKVTRSYTPNGSRYEGEIGWNRRFADSTLAPIGKYRVTVKASDLAGNFSQKEATLVIPAGDSPGEETIIQPLVEADDPPLETTFALPPEEPQPTPKPVESVFGGTSLAALNEERRSETPATSLPGSENILWGAGALAAMAAMTAYYEQKRREEEEAQRAALQAQASAANAAWQARQEQLREQAKIENYLQGKAMLNEALKNSGLSQAEQTAIRAQAQANGTAAGLNLTAAAMAGLNALVPDKGKGLAKIINNDPEWLLDAASFAQKAERFPTMDSPGFWLEIGNMHMSVYYPANEDNFSGPLVRIPGLENYKARKDFLFSYTGVAMQGTGYFKRDGNTTMIHYEKGHWELKGQRVEISDHWYYSKTHLPVPLHLLPNIKLVDAKFALGPGKNLTDYYSLAAPPNFPIGTYVYIPDLAHLNDGGLFEIQDRGGAFRENAHRFDLYAPHQTYSEIYNQDGYPSYVWIPSEHIPK